jgi:carboxylesterase
MSVPLMEGADPYSCEQGRDGVLLIHGFTGQPYSMRPLGLACATAGFRVELPRLPGHGTNVEDLERYRFDDWVSFLDDLYVDFAGHCEHVVIIGLSMGGTLACWLAEAHPEIAGLVLVNPLIEQTTEKNMDALQKELNEGHTSFATPGSDVKRAGATGRGYDATPIRPLLSLFAGTVGVGANLANITAPVLLFSSREDHVVPSSTGDTIVEQVRGPVTRIFLENSFHVATIDNDAPELIEQAVAFIREAVRR